MAGSRRGFLLSCVAGAVAGASGRCRAARSRDDIAERSAQLAGILKQPVLETEFVREPVEVTAIELLRNGGTWLVRSRSAAGVEAVTVPNPSRMAETCPIVLRRLIPVFLRRDARELESTLWDAYRSRSNYKLQGIALWAGTAALEMNLLELLARTANRPLADFFGGQRRRSVDVYYASSHRGNRPEEEVDDLKSLIAESGVRAVKFRVGGRMSRNEDSLPGRSDALIPLVRKELGDEIELYADSNSSYDVEHAVRLGRLMEDHGYGFFEEPCPFDWLWEKKQVADALRIPVAGGEQEFSLRRWMWMLANRGIDIAQPDLYYGGGMIRATRVARMAAAAGMPVVPHMSGGGLGYLDVVHFASWTPNIGPYMEFKGGGDLPIECPTSSLKCENGKVHCPTGVGFGVTIDDAFVRQARPVSLPTE